MPDDEAFRRYLQAGMAWFSVTQQKAEGILRDLTDSSETAMGQAQKVFDRFVDRGRQGSDELRDLVRAEIREQIGALGLATTDDIARLEAKIDAVQATPPPATPPTATPPTATPPTATPPTGSEGGAEPAQPRKSSAARPAARPKPAPITKSGPITKAAPSRKAPGPKPGAPAGRGTTAAAVAKKGTRASRPARPASGTAGGPPPRSSPEEA